MSLTDQLMAELKNAMKKKDKTRVDTVRLLISQLKNARIDSEGELSPEQEMQVLLSAAKKRKEAIQAYKSGGREDLLEKELAELKIIEEFLPAQLSDEEIEKEVAAVIEQIGATGMKDLGRVMGEAMKKLKGKADGKKVQAIVRSKLA
ncbi:glutamyl-tRNA amidotransferase [candidate division KSB1 bacterium 4484_87]|nr:MAG: glutamyl-tRNA amidotransferase [candidate division KSB1 bacterium 4484_87]